MSPVDAYLLVALLMIPIMFYLIWYHVEPRESFMYTLSMALLSAAVFPAMLLFFTYYFIKFRIEDFIENRKNQKKQH